MIKGDSRVKKVCILHFPRMEDFHGYSIDCLDPVPYFSGSNSGSGRAAVYTKLYEAKSLDQMYRDKDPSYMRFISDFVDRYQDADLVVLASYNPVHPEVLCNHL